MDKRQLQLLFREAQEKPMKYDIKKDIIEWTLKHGNLPYSKQHDVELPKWLK